MAVAQDVDMIREQERLFNFLKKYSLHQYYQKFLLQVVHRLYHLKDVCGDDASLDEIGLSRIERQRLRKKVKENVEWMGRFVVGFLIHQLKLTLAIQLCKHYESVIWRKGLSSVLKTYVVVFYGLMPIVT